MIYKTCATVRLRNQNATDDDNVDYFAENFGFQAWKINAM